MRQRVSPRRLRPTSSSTRQKTSSLRPGRQARSAATTGATPAMSNCASLLASRPLRASRSPPDFVPTKGPIVTITDTASATGISNLALIGGERRGASDGATIDVINPSNGQVITTIPRLTAADVDDAVAAAKSAFPAWAALEPLQRAKYLDRLADAIEANGEELAALDSLDNGSPLHEMRRDSNVAAAQLRYYAGLVLEAQGATIPSSSERLMYSLRQPYGVVGRISAFNHPLLFTVGKMAGALAAGNTVVTKPSEHTSLSSLAAADIINEIFPPGVINVITGYGHEAGDALVAHPDVQRLAFIGADGTGRMIQRRAAEVGVKHVTLELGGKNPLVIFPDADVDKAIAGALNGMNFTWQGQSCGSTSRLIVHRSLHRRVVDALAEKMEAIRSGMPHDENTDTGAIVNKQQFDKVMKYIEIGKSEGADLVAGGYQVTEGELAQGLFVRPTLFDNVDPYGRLAQEEIFGPVLAAMPFDTYDEALTIANSVQYGLTASAFTQDLRTAHAYARDIQAGYVWINETSRHFLGSGFGGYKNSGIGREENHEEILSWTQAKNVSVLFGDGGPAGH
ncbi:aldehyde dehydrogenase [Salinibacterium hongtaonis]|uniref:Aldehyde dehydrogenase n=1 Tax=Homoserinimonas hongtaonis TaxID=2079791 RepID=A0A2U1T2H0_9MICO|nr:aldehyde dehydrogenase [Salinibacterium hongtaonis]